MFDKCERCGDERPDCLSMSFFNKQMICGNCEAVEREHPQFNDARRADELQCMQGNFNFEGIGLPPELEGGHHGKDQT